VANGRPSEWRRVVDTSLPSPQDILEPGKEAQLHDPKYKVGARSVVVLLKGATETSPAKSATGDKTK
jgi:hypothetical protein